uniref:Cytochrome c oxidase subunit 2 n=1 Tax=Laevipilina antarctica TaxID=358449 RepID=A0A1L6BZY8_9MOLL|nr:cytochrome c oxidase subunit 2 [Laevipilina antarctica]APQ42966.1 cytochrome c oxidase subunit 2 [Laevipilina antarctica]
MSFMAFWGQLGFQDSSSPFMEELIFFHDHAMVVFVLVMSLVGYVSVGLIYNKFTARFIMESQGLEIIWTILPAVVLLFLALPSLQLLYLSDEIWEPGLTVKALGHQWYWAYEYYDFLEPIEIDSYMVPTDELEVGEYRLLEADMRMIVPMGVSVRVLVTSSDVLHSWTVPSLGVKVDAVPGRLNQVSFICNRPGVFYGQCSELCGANHSFMPIVVEVVDHESFCAWASWVLTSWCWEKN